MNLKFKSIIREYFFGLKLEIINLFRKEKWAKKLFVLFSMLTVIFVSHFSLYEHFKNLLENNKISLNEFLSGNNNTFMSVKCVLNPGVAFSMFGSKNPGFVYTIQSLSVLFVIILFVFVKDWHFSIPLSGIMFGGLTNIIDRSIPLKIGGEIHYNSVLDYFSINWNFLFFPKSIFNIADIFVVTSLVGAVVMLIVKMTIYFYKNKKAQKLTKND